MFKGVRPSAAPALGGGRALIMIVQCNAPSWQLWARTYTLHTPLLDMTFLICMQHW